LIDRADMALYRVKAKERSGIAVFDMNDESIALERAMIEQALRKAVVEAALDLHFQPIINLATGQINGFEALARWHDTRLGHISPAVFIPIAEQIGIIEQLTDSLLRKAATVAAGWPSRLTLSFNLSADELSRPSAGLKIVSIISECGLPPKRFEAEVTETAIMKNLENARRTIEALKAAGASVALDDFGTGYSSLSQIRDLPLDKIKIDKSFVDRICADPRIASLVRSIVDMCERLELRCVAEGIERQDQLDELKLCGCYAGQGYLFSRPVPKEKVHEYICGLARQAA
jgi:predicted signal transduction protein with EAL and GGDEF domain